MNSQYEIQLFTNELFGNVRSILDANGNPWFVGADVASCLGYNDVDQAIRKHVPDRNKTLINNQFFKPVDSTGFNIPNRGLIIINEAGLYRLIFSSKLPAAEAFTNWVTEEVLPAMRRIGFTRSMQLLDEEKQRAEMRATFSEQSALAAGIREAQITSELYQIKDKIYNSNIPEEIKSHIITYDPEYKGGGTINKQ